MTRLADDVALLTPHLEADPPPQAAPGDDPHAGLEGLKVMIVDDEFLAAWHLQALLEDMGVIHSELAHDGPSALELAARFHPDLVLMDMNLGAGIDGAETARRLLAERPVRLIFITAYGDAGTIGRIQEAAPGAAVLIKPANPARLRDLVVGTLPH
ncbi:response regulator [Phenylobacterium sp.]|uniref:response regulator n=1 Tax=Phenylobacterium sp. TaxID=1871053 RepID=UPI002E320F91|nr:response regulator [Phenylobacterium sp.]HEX2561054.1 response regulator [Phenylobacterium sp.]